MEKKQAATYQSTTQKLPLVQSKVVHAGFNQWGKVPPGIVLYLELAALQAGNTLEHRLDDVPLHAIEEVNPASLQVLIHLRIQEHLEVLDIEWRSLHCVALQSAALTDDMSCVCDACMLSMTVTLYGALTAAWVYPAGIACGHQSKAMHISREGCRSTYRRAQGTPSRYGLSAFCS